MFSTDHFLRHTRGTYDFHCTGPEHSDPITCKTSAFDHSPILMSRHTIEVQDYSVLLSNSPLRKVPGGCIRARQQPDQLACYSLYLKLRGAFDFRPSTGRLSHGPISTLSRQGCAGLPPRPFKTCRDPRASTSSRRHLFWWKFGDRSGGLGLFRQDHLSRENGPS